LGHPGISSRVAASDVTLFEFFATAVALFPGRRPAGRIVLRDHEVIVRKLAMECREARGIEWLNTALRLIAAYLISIVVFSKVDRIIALTPEDRDALSSYFPWLRSKVVDIPVPFAPAELRVNRGPDQRLPRDLVMVANFFHRPNVDAIIWFLQQCAPHLKPGLTLNVFGLDGPLDSVALDSGHVTVVRHGFVEDLNEAIPAGAIAVAPVVSGGGVRMKNLLLASMGIPIVTTPLGNQGIGFTDGREAVVTESGLEMARRINELVDTQGVVEAMGLAARDFVRAEFDSASIAGRLVTELIQIAPAGAAGASR
jgi:polysaccharide biosynthesis protein PslH